MDYDLLKDAQSDLGTRTVIVKKKNPNLVVAIACFAHVSLILRYVLLVETSPAFGYLCAFPRN